MTDNRAQIALSRARRDYDRALRALLADDLSERARHRHARRARVAAGRIAEARRDLARLTSIWEEQAA